MTSLQVSGGPMALIPAGRGSGARARSTGAVDTPRTGKVTDQNHPARDRRPHGTRIAEQDDLHGPMSAPGPALSRPESAGRKLSEPITICRLSRQATATRAIASPASVHETVHEQTPDVTYNRRWGGWDSNPRPTDYENSGPTLRTRCLHRYHGAVPPIAPIAPFARMTRSTNRSTPHRGDHPMPATERDYHLADQPVRARWHKAARGEQGVANRRDTGS